MSANNGRKITIIGGGIGGLTAAVAFAQDGANVTLHEQASALTEVGAGLQITPNGVRVLDALGVSLSDIGLIAQAVRPIDALTGKSIARFDLFDQSPPYRFVHRADLIDLLAGAAKRGNVTFEMGAQVASIRPGITPQVQMTDGSTGMHAIFEKGWTWEKDEKPLLGSPDACPMRHTGYCISGTLVVRMTEIALITPPVGMNVYILSSVARDIPLTTIFRGTAPFVLADLLHVALLLAIPALVLWLPSL